MKHTPSNKVKDLQRDRKTRPEPFTTLSTQIHYNASGALRRAVNLKCLQMPSSCQRGLFWCSPSTYSFNRCQNKLCVSHSASTRTAAVHCPIKKNQKKKKKRQCAWMRLRSNKVKTEIHVQHIEPESKNRHETHFSLQPVCVHPDRIQTAQSATTVLVTVSYREVQQTP